MGRFPFTSFPTGWYQVAYSEEIPAGEVLPLSVLGRELVLFRTEAGSLHALDAHCPHLGAHLGHGGRVEGDSLRCPFHAWRIGSDGRCLSIPYAEKVPPKAAARAWRLREIHGLVLLYHGDPNVPPAWEVPSVPECLDPDWAKYDKHTWTFRSHVQEVAENIVDPAHFRFVHRVPTLPRTSLEAVGPSLRSVSVLRMMTPRGEVDACIEADGSGLGFWRVRFVGVIETLLLSTVTPLDGERVQFRISFLVKAKDFTGVARHFIDYVCAQAEEDIPIWEHKMYRAQPRLCAGDGPIMAFRKWARQFYPP
jgi:nitrite reductase/ring-hydroxylating ferredoxin subunit